MASSRILPTKQFKDLLTSSVVASLEKETVSVQTDNDEAPILPIGDQATYFFSNFAAGAVFEMIANGAIGDTQSRLLFHWLGKPIDEIHELFPLTVQFFTVADFDAGGPRIRVSTRNWVQRSLTLKSETDDVIKHVYMSDVCYVSFFTPRFKFTHDLTVEVNAWVKHKTRELIRDSFGSVTLDPATRLISTAAVDFEGEWSVPFEYAGVREFTLANGDVVQAPFMTSKAKQYVKQFTGFKVLSIPFRQHEATRFAMLFYLPDRTEDFADLQAFIGEAETVLMDMDVPTIEQVEVRNLLIPKFKIKMRGIQPYAVLDFLTPEMVDNTDGSTSQLGVYKIVHNSYVQINEKGTRAAGAVMALVQEVTVEKPEPMAAQVESLAVDIQPRAKRMRFEANRPFLFYIRDTRFGRQLFSGGLMDPLGCSFT